MSFDSLIFDMDGTLWDTVAEVTASWKETITRSGVPLPAQIDSLSDYFGMTEDEIARRLFPQLTFEESSALMRRCNTEECDYIYRHGTTIYPGLIETLEKLSKHFRLFIVSNCVDGYIETFFKTFDTAKYFEDYEFFGRTGMKKAQNIRLICERNGLKEPVYVGDTVWDAEACETAGVPFIYASYGFGELDDTSRAYRVIRSFPDLLELIPGEAQS